MKNRKINESNIRLYAAQMHMKTGGNVGKLKLVLVVF